MTGQDRIIFANRTMKKILLLLVLLLCVLLCGVVADTYEKGRKRAQRAEETSNVDSSDTSCGRHQRRRRPVADSDSEGT